MFLRLALFHTVQHLSLRLKVIATIVLEICIAYRTNIIRVVQANAENRCRLPVIYVENVTQSIAF